MNNALDIANCAAWALYPSTWKHRYYFPGGGTVDNRGVVMLEIVSQKEEKRHLFKVSHMTVNHHYRWHPYYHDGWCFDLTSWCYVICTHRVIWSNVALGLYKSIKTWRYYEIIVWRWIGPFMLVIFVDTSNLFAHVYLDW